jgi:hypothetical protein
MTDDTVCKVVGGLVQKKNECKVYVDKATKLAVARKKCWWPGLFVTVFFNC